MATDINIDLIRGSMCIWVDCNARFDGDLPVGWRWLLLWHEPTAAADMTLAEVTLMPTCDRDAVLCPEHVEALQSSLKSLKPLE